MQGNFDKCLVEVLKHEGGYVNHPADPGGMTNLGVTKATYEDWVGHPVSEQVMRNLNISHVRALYFVRYWKVVKGDDLPVGLDLCVFDFAVNAGPRRAIKYLQMMVGAKPDGQIGPTTLKQMQQYIRTHGHAHPIDRYQAMRNAYYQKLRTFKTFGRGWLRRVAAVTVHAHRMLKEVQWPKN